MKLNQTHDVKTRSWLASANDAGSDFPIQNLPYGVFRRAGKAEAFRGGVAIGDQIIDMAALASAEALEGLPQLAAQACAEERLNHFMSMGHVAWRAGPAHRRRSELCPSEP